MRIAPILSAVIIGAVVLLFAPGSSSPTSTTASVRMLPHPAQAANAHPTPTPTVALRRALTTPVRITPKPKAPVGVASSPPHAGPKVATPPPPPPPPSLPNVNAALEVVRASEADGVTVGFAIYSSNGQMLGGYGATSENYGGSITKSMLLVAYLQQTGNGIISPEAQGELESMIEVSDNDAADWVYAHLSSPNRAVLSVAASVGMTGFQLDTSDPVYVLGQSLVTANDLAMLFADIGNLIPPAQRSFGMGLLSHLSSADQVGLLQAGLPGAVYSKEGWKPEPDGLEGAPYIVNQAGRFSVNGNTYGIAFTVAGVSDKPSGEAIIERIAAALT